MKALEINLDEQILNKLETLSQEKNKSKEEIVQEIIEEALERIYLEKAQKIINEEKNLLKKLA